MQRILKAKARLGLWSALIITPILILMGGSYWKVQSDLTQLTLVRRGTLAFLASTLIQERLERLVDLGQTFASRVQFQRLVSQGRWTEAIELQRRNVTEFPFIERIFISDLKGNVRAGIPPLLEARGRNLSQRDWFQGVSHGWKPFVSEVFIRVGKPPIKVVAIACPIQLDSGQPLGVLVVLVRSATIAQWATDIDIGASGFMYIVDRKGHLVSHPMTNERSVIVDYSKVPIVQKISQGLSGVEITYNPIEKAERLSAYRQVPGFGWGVVVTQPVNKAFEYRNKTLDVMLVSYGAVLFLLFAAIALVARFIDLQQLVGMELASARDAAIETARLKAEFLATMSHEIRTPLNAIIGMTNILMDTRLDADQSRYAKTIYNAGEALLALVNNILDFSKIESGRLVFEKIDFDLQELLEGAVEILARQAQEKGLELALDIDPQLPVLLRGDPGRLRQIVINLLNNAIKFTEKGEVVLRAKGEWTERDAKVHLEVQDTGIGISSESQTRLFQAFSQADASVTRRFGGTGLGLAICAKLAKGMNGQIGVESLPDKGSTFWLRLPLDRQSSAKSAKASVPPDLNELRVLIVDDNATNREILTRQLHGMKIRCESADGAKEAMRRLNEALSSDRPYSLAIIDMQMPEMDGLSLARNIHKNPRLHSIKIIMLASLTQHPDSDSLIDAGVTRWLTKPMRPSALLDCLMNASAQPQQSPEKGRSAPGTAPSRGSFRILIAEDNHMNLEVLTLQLKKLGYSADVARNGKEAVERFGGSLYDLVFMDCHMPMMDGYEAATRIRAIEDSRLRTPIVAMTANALEGDREKCLASGMTDYISKPIDPKRIAAILEEWDRPLDPSVYEDFRSTVLEGGRDNFRALMAGFLKSSEASIAELRQSAAERSQTKIAETAHQLAGSFGQLGAVTMNRLCRRLERAARSGSLDPDADSFAELARDFQRLQSALAEELKDA